MTDLQRSGAGDIEPVRARSSAATVESPTCEAEEPISGVQCERAEGHEGAHIFIGTRTVIAWGWPT